MLEGIVDQPSLAEKCEHLRSLDKLVIFDDPDSGVRLRLNLFKDPLRAAIPRDGDRG